MKQCSKCRHVLETNVFNRNVSNRDGLQKYCKSCHIASSKAYYEKNKVQTLEKSRQNTIKRKLKQPDRLAAVRLYNNMLEKQKYKCAICKKKNTSDIRFHIDHCHKTDKIRGLLCNKCNRGIGYLCESETILSSAIQYLKNNKD